MSSSRLEHKLVAQVGKASREHLLLEPGDRVMVCLSGGKDSWVMLRLLRLLRRRVPFCFDMVAVNLDQGDHGFPQHKITDWLDAHDYTYKMLAQDTRSIVRAKIPPGKTTCSLCSRLRRGILYSAAVELGCTKIALGHHRDDMIETLLLNLFYAGQIKSMPPRLTSDDGRNTVIRPLAYCREAEIAEYAAEVGFPILPCDLCGSQDNLHRQKIKALVAQLAAENDKVPGNIFAALGNVVPSHLLDTELRVAAGMTAVGQDEVLAALG